MASSLVLGSVILTPTHDLRVPSIAFVPSVLDYLNGPPTLRTEPLDQSHVVDVAQTDRAHLARVLQLRERAPGLERLRERPERRVEDVGVEVGRAKLAE